MIPDKIHQEETAGRASKANSNFLPLQQEGVAEF
jgi:hypothetical protein